MKINISIFLLLAQVVSYSQDKHDYQWVFGHIPNKPEIKFGGTLISFNQNDMQSNYFDINCKLEENASICDEHGHLLMYSNGCAIYGSDHKIIENGDGINPGDTYDYYCKNKDWLFYPKNKQEIFIPGFTKDTYYLFHLGDQRNSEIVNFYRTTIVIKNKLPVVTEKNKNYGTYAVNEGLQAIRHGNGRDWWIIMKHGYTNYFNKFLLTPLGLSKLMVQDIGPVWGRPNSIVQASFSPNGKYYVIASYENGVHLFHFDRCSGQFYRYTPLKHLPQDTLFFSMGVAFSANSKFIYLSTFFSIYQYDLTARDISNSYTLIDTLDRYIPPGTFFPLTFYQLQLAPDHKIYCNTTNETNVLHVIHHPEKKGKACNLKQHDIYLPTTYVQSMPNFPHYRLYDDEGSPCDTLGITKNVLAQYRFEQDSGSYLKFEFTDLSFYQPESWLWDFGEPLSASNYSTEQYPQHEFSEAGMYKVCLTASNAHSSDQICKNILIGPVANVDEHNSFRISEQFYLAPNPCFDVLHIQINNYYPKRLFVEFNNSLGYKVKQQKLNAGMNTIDIYDLPQGLYHLHFLDDGKIVGSETIMVIRF